MRYKSVSRVRYIPIILLKQVGQSRAPLESQVKVFIVNPTTEGVQILWVGGGEASEAPPKKSMMEWAETPCCKKLCSNL